MATGNSNIFFCSPRTLGKMNPFWRAYLFKGVGSTTNSFLFTTICLSVWLLQMKHHSSIHQGVPHCKHSSPMLRCWTRSRSSSSGAPRTRVSRGRLERRFLRKSRKLTENVAFSLVSWVLLIVKSSFGMYESSAYDELRGELLEFSTHQHFMCFSVGFFCWHTWKPKTPRFRLKSAKEFESIFGCFTWSQLRSFGGFRIKVFSVLERTQIPLMNLNFQSCFLTKLEIFLFGSVSQWLGCILVLSGCKNPLKPLWRCYIKIALFFKNEILLEWSCWMICLKDSKRNSIDSFFNLNPQHLWRENLRWEKGN